MLALVLGTILAVGALVFVLYPLFAGAERVARRAPLSPAQAASAAEQEAVAALREIEFDRVTGKLSDADYDELHARDTARALDAMRGDGTPAGVDDPVEAAVRAYRARQRSCGTCGPRPEADALYCSTCGHYLPGVCAACGSDVTEAAAAFCTECGQQLAA
ncbi:MAG: zinc ribbon domain-containing protein [bacterium]